MTARIRLILVLSTAASAAAIALSGCGGGGGGGGTSADPAAVAPKQSSVFVEGTVRPGGELKSNLEDLIRTVAGISDPGKRIVDQIDASLADAKTKEKLTYQDDIEPWLGEKAGIFLERYDGQQFQGVGGAVQTTDSGAAADFVDKAKEAGDKDGSYNGVDYVIDGSDGTTVGVVDDFLVFGEDEQTFKDAVDASDGDSLDENDDYSSTIANASDGSLADVYVNIGDLISQSGAAVDQQVLQFYQSLGYNLSNGTALASLVPSSDRVELDVSTNAGGKSIPTGDVADLLGSFPANSFAALATPDFGARLKQAIDQLDKVGIPPDVPPGALKSTLAQAGIDLDKIAGSIGDIGLFAVGTDLRSLGGAVVITTGDPQAASEAVKGIGTLLRRSRTKGFTPVKGNAAGFAFRTPGLGPKPLVVLASGEKIAVGYGVEATEQAVSAPSANTLADSDVFKAASEALGDTNMTGVIDFAPILGLAKSFGAAADPSFAQVAPYLQKLDFLALGSGQEGDLSVSKVILTFERG
jgi:hypothetical protein